MRNNFFFWANKQTNKMFIKISSIVIIVIIGSKSIEMASGFGNVWNKLHLVGGSSGSSYSSPCISQNNKLLSLLNLLCNTTQTTSLTTRDACYGCFFRAGSLTSGSTQLTMLSQCSTMYLIGTIYAQCGTQLALVANGTTPTTAPTQAHHCYTGYCEFVRCIRRINSNNLIDSCFMENLVGRDLSLQIQRIYFYTNLTSCILAKTRCSTYNPISGQLQQQQPQQHQQYGGGQSYQLLLNNYNSLQISKNGDIRLIAFPSTINVADLFCSRTSTLDQSAYGNFIC